MPIRFCFLLLLLLSACQQSPPPTATATTVSTSPPSLTPTAIATATATATATMPPTATATAQPTDTPQPTSTPLPTATPATQLTLEQLRNGHYPTTLVESGAVTLEDGEFQQVISADSPLRTYARLSDVYAFGDLNDDGDDEAAVVLATNTGGSGVFYELFIVEMVENEPSVVTSSFLGDRLVMRAMSIEDGMLTVDLRQQGAGDALCCPTEEAQFTYRLQDEALVQTGQVTATSAEVNTAGDTVNAFLQTYLQDPTGSSSLEYVTETVQAAIESDGISQVTGITEPIASYFYAIQQRSATDVRVKATLNQATAQNLFFDLARLESEWRIDVIEPARPATDAFGDDPCRLMTTEESVAYERPRVQSGVFATLSAETSVVINAQTATGWYGFEPGMAQAANTGVFRYRWIAPDESHQLSASCENLPLVVAVQATQCYTMPQTDVVVYAQADPNSAMVATLPAGTSFAAIVEQQDGWVWVDLMDSSLFASQQGWISADTLNLNGASCATLLDGE